MYCFTEYNFETHRFNYFISIIRVVSLLNWYKKKLCYKLIKWINGAWRTGDLVTHYTNIYCDWVTNLRTETKHGYKMQFFYKIIIMNKICQDKKLYVI